MKLLLDTNILIDFAIKREPHYENAKIVMLLGYLHEVELWVGSSQMSDFIYVLTEGGKVSLAEQARQVMQKLLEFVHVYATDKEDCVFMTGSNWNDLEDCLVYRNAAGVKADAIVSRNYEEFTNSTIETFDYEGLFSYLKESFGLDYALVDL